MNLRGRSLLLLLVTAVLWSLSGVLVKSIDWNPLAISSARSLIAGLTIAALMRGRLSLRGATKMQWLTGLFMATVSILFVSSTKLTTAANAIVLQYTAPFWVALLAPLILRERTSRLDWAFMLLAFCGVGLFFKDALSTDGLLGNILAITSGVFFAALAICTRYIKDAQPAQAMVLGNIITFAVGVWFWRAPWPGLTDILLLLVLGVFQFGLAYYLYALASAGATSLEIILIPIIEPILNPIWVFLVVGEKPGFWGLLGGAVVLLSVAAWSAIKTMRPDSPRGMV